MQGERLILVVDGLDEDRGVGGPDAYSVAALLPANPPTGMRVVVAGRPDPPIPDDVPRWHRLREPGIIRPLVPSAYAQGIETLAQQELRRRAARHARRAGFAQAAHRRLGRAERPRPGRPDRRTTLGIEDVLHGCPVAPSSGE
jgi:hypothetical protein